MSHKKENLKALDSVMVSIIGDLCSGAGLNASSSVQSILEISASYIDTEAKSALIEFRNLYLGSNSELEKVSESINGEVDDLVDSLKTKLEAGEDLDLLSRAEDPSLDELSRNRLALAALQKRLEKIISMDEAIKVKLLPILTSMQFEDLIHQRLDHIAKMWEIAGQAFSENSSKDFTDVAQKIAQVLVLKAERDIYYPKMLGIQPPETVDEQKSISDILF